MSDDKENKNRDHESALWIADEIYNAPGDVMSDVYVPPTGVVSSVYETSGEVAGDVRLAPEEVVRDVYVTESNVEDLSNLKRKGRRII